MSFIVEIATKVQNDASIFKTLKRSVFSLIVYKNLSFAPKRAYDVHRLQKAFTQRPLYDFTLCVDFQSKYKPK